MCDLSIVIPCRDDVRIKQCLESIDEDVEIVISLNGSSMEVDRIVSDFAATHKRTVIVRSIAPNLAAAMQLGSLAATGDVILYMDSDCRFFPGTIRQFKIAAKTQEVVKG